MVDVDTEDVDKVAHTFLLGNWVKSSLELVTYVGEIVGVISNDLGDVL